MYRVIQVSKVLPVLVLLVYRDLPARLVDRRVIPAFKVLQVLTAQLVLLVPLVYKVLPVLVRQAYLDLPVRLVDLKAIRVFRARLVLSVVLLVLLVWTALQAFKAPRGRLEPLVFKAPRA